MIVCDASTDSSVSGSVGERATSTLRLKIGDGLEGSGFNMAGRLLREWTMKSLQHIESKYPGFVVKFYREQIAVTPGSNDDLVAEVFVAPVAEVRLYLPFIAPTLR